MITFPLEEFYRTLEKNGYLQLVRELLKMVTRWKGNYHTPYTTSMHKDVTFEVVMGGGRERVRVKCEGLYHPNFVQELLRLKDADLRVSRVDYVLELI